MPPRRSAPRSTTSAARNRLARFLAALSLVVSLVLVMGPIAAGSESDPPEPEPGVTQLQTVPEVLGETRVRPGAGVEAGEDMRIASSASGAGIPVTLGRPADAFPEQGWFDSGPAVPLLAVATLGMLFVGAWMILVRCRTCSATR